MNLIQLAHPNLGRRIGLVDEPEIILLDESIDSTYKFFKQLIASGQSLKKATNPLISKTRLSYDTIYNQHDQWYLLPPIDCPLNPMWCILSGTGLTHKKSADNRNKMHDQLEEEKMTDSMKMYMWGESGGKPQNGQTGVQPEWFYKGNGHNLKAHGQSLDVPSFADDGGEEAEIAAIYIVSEDGIPFRIGFAQANEFSDHVMEKKNYLYLAPSKIRNCSLGPELIPDLDFKSLTGTVSINRGKDPVWHKEISSGEEAMAHSLSNLEYHHFKYDQHRLPGQCHIHFLGASAFSFGENIILQDGDEMCVNFQHMGRSLVNPIQINTHQPSSVTIETLKLK